MLGPALNRFSSASLSDAPSCVLRWQITCFGGAMRGILAAYTAAQSLAAAREYYPVTCTQVAVRDLLRGALLKYRKRRLWERSLCAPCHASLGPEALCNGLCYGALRV